MTTLLRRRGVCAHMYAHHQFVPPSKLHQSITGAFKATDAEIRSFEKGMSYSLRCQRERDLDRPGQLPSLRYKAALYKHATKFRGTRVDDTESAAGIAPFWRYGVYCA